MPDTPAVADRTAIDPELERWRERGRRNGLTVSRNVSIDVVRETAETISQSERQLAYQHGYESAFLGALNDRIASAASMGGE